MKEALLRFLGQTNISMGVNGMAIDFYDSIQIAIFKTLRRVDTT